MPIYEFACRDCRTIFSFFARRVNTDVVPGCPRCGRPLERQVSLFRAGRSKGAGADPLGLGDDGLDEDFPDVPDFDADDPRVAAAVADLGDKIDHIDPSDTAGAAGLMKAFAEKSGVKFNDGVMDAIGRIAAGDDSEEAQGRLAEAVADGHLLENLKRAVGHARHADAPFAKDPNLYDL